MVQLKKNWKRSGARNVTEGYLMDLLDSILLPGNQRYRISNVPGAGH